MVFIEKVQVAAVWCDLLLNFINIQTTLKYCGYEFCRVIEIVAREKERESIQLSIPYFHVIKRICAYIPIGRKLALNSKVRLIARYA